MIWSIIVSCYKHGCLPDEYHLVLEKAPFPFIRNQGSDLFLLRFFCIYRYSEYIIKNDRGLETSHLFRKPYNKILKLHLCSVQWLEITHLIIILNLFETNLQILSLIIIIDTLNWLKIIKDDFPVPRAQFLSFKYSHWLYQCTDNTRQTCINFTKRSYWGEETSVHFFLFWAIFFLFLNWLSFFVDYVRTFLNCFLWIIWYVHNVHE